MEYLTSLQPRQKWVSPKRNIQDDIVIVKDDDLPRNQWKLARVVKTSCDADGHIRKVKLAMSCPSLDLKGKRKTPVILLERPIQKLILLVESQN